MRRGLRTENPVLSIIPLAAAIAAVLIVDGGLVVSLLVGGAVAGIVALGLILVVGSRDHAG